MESASSRDTRAVVVIVVSLFASAAVTVGGYESVALSILFWVIVLGGLVYLIWPDLPQRLSDRFTGDRSWTAHKPTWSGHPGSLSFHLSPPRNREDDPNVDPHVDPSPSCEVESPDGIRQMLDVIQPRAETSGPWNLGHDYYLALYPPDRTEPRKDWRSSPLDVGNYRVVWRRTKGQPGHAILRVQRFRITPSGRVR
jgi:hypothetical protein